MSGRDLTNRRPKVLIKALLERFYLRYTPNGVVVYAGEAGRKLYKEELAYIGKLGVKLDEHARMPNVIIHLPDKECLVLVEATATHGPIDAKRHAQLKDLFKGCTSRLVFVSAFPSRNAALKFLYSVSWESEVWIADEPSHLIHFNGRRGL
jgi:adenine-specific DNA-methyltransferase